MRLRAVDDAIGDRVGGGSDRDHLIATD